MISNYNGDLAVQILIKILIRSTLGNNGVYDANGLITNEFVTLGETVFRGNASVKWSV